MIWPELLQWSTTKISTAYGTAIHFVIIEFLIYALPAKRMKAFGYGGGILQQLVTERACHACLESLPPHPHHLGHRRLRHPPPPNTPQWRLARLHARHRMLARHRRVSGSRPTDPNAAICEHGTIRNLHLLRENVRKREI